MSDLLPCPLFIGGDLHLQGRESFAFFTQHKVTTTRWFSCGEGTIWADQ